MTAERVVKWLFDKAEQAKELSFSSTYLCVFASCLTKESTNLILQCREFDTVRALLGKQNHFSGTRQKIRIPNHDIP